MLKRVEAGEIATNLPPRACGKCRQKPGHAGKVQVCDALV